MLTATEPKVATLTNVTRPLDVFTSKLNNIGRRRVERISYQIEPNKVESCRRPCSSMPFRPSPP